jgi:hypothetical protein
MEKITRQGTSILFSIYRDEKSMRHAECTGEVRNAPFSVENLEGKRPFDDTRVDERIRL